MAVTLRLGARSENGAATGADREAPAIELGTILRPPRPACSPGLAYVLVAFHDLDLEISARGHSGTDMDI